MKAAISRIVNVSTFTASTGLIEEAAAGFAVNLEEQLLVR